VITALASHLLQRGESLPIPLIVVGGAPLHTGDRSLIERAFSPREILHFYPTTDAGALGCGDRQTGDYQSFPETHLIEVLGADGVHVSEGTEGLLVVTALDSLAAPIIRYAVGDRVTYLGRSARGERVRLRKIRRASDAMIGEFKIPLADLDGWRDVLAQQGFATSALQIAKRRDVTGRPQLIVRLETSEHTADLEAAALDLVRTDEDLAYALRHGLLCVPRVEVFPPGGLLKGRFKLPIFVDEMEPV
jgi:phenylacetate-coenzyme A ligase PaaK-like adenylate-forming protein